MRSGLIESSRDTISARIRSRTCSGKGILNLTHNSGHYDKFGNPKLFEASKQFIIFKSFSIGFFLKLYKLTQ